MITGSRRTTTSRYDSPPKDGTNASMWCRWWLESHVTITSVPVVEFIFVTICKILRIGFLHPQKLSQSQWSLSEKLQYLDFFIRHPVAHAGIEFIQWFPCQLVIWKELPSLDSSLKRWGPNLVGHDPVSMTEQNRWIKELTVSGAFPMLSVIRSGKARAYLIPRLDNDESPPIFPSTLNWLSPCLEKKMLRGLRCKFIK